MHCGLLRKFKVPADSWAVRRRNDDDAGVGHLSPAANGFCESGPRPPFAGYPAAPRDWLGRHAQIASFWCAGTAARDAAVDAGSQRAGGRKQSPAGRRTAALEFLSAVASGDPQAVALTIHPDDLQALRLRILALLRDEAKRGDGTIRSRLFGQGMPLEDIEHLTDTGFYATLAYKLYLAGREYTEVEGLAAIPDKGDQVQVRGPRSATPGPRQGRRS